MPQSVILEDPPDGTGYEPRGAARKLWKCKAHEVMLSGPAETGKTLCSLQKLDALMIKYPGAQAAIIRKTRKSMTGSVLQTYENKVLSKDSGVIPYGGKHVEWYDYPNGSRIFVGGMDNPDKVLSSERDFIYINQSEELTLDDWEKLTTRCTGRAGNTPYSQIFGDCNPGPSNHWILQRVKEGALTFIESRHEDNPTLYDDNGNITPQGEISIGILDALTGVRLHRLRHGRWVSAEGVIYESWDRAVHLIPSFKIPSDWYKFRAVDFGYTNPFGCQWYAEDPDGRLYLYRELYKTQLLVEDAGKEIKRLSAGENIDITVCDHDAEDRATLEKHMEGPTIAANKSVKIGIEAVQMRLRKAGDGKPRLFIFQDCLVEPDKRLIDAKKPYCTEQEIETYIWEPAADGRAAKETPRKVDDHGCFIAGTMITTQSGCVPIELIQPGDFVLTREGFKEVLWSGITNVSSDIFKLTMSNGSELIGTGNHPIYVNRNHFARLDSIRYGDILWQQETEKRLSLTELNLEGILNQLAETIGYIINRMLGIVRKESDTYIKKFGNLYMEKSQPGIIFTILMVTPLITILKTYNVLMNIHIFQKHLAITNQFIKQKLLSTCQIFGHSHQSGIEAMMGESGIDNRQLKPQNIKKIKNTCVKTAVKHFIKNHLEQISSAAMHVKRNIDINQVSITLYAYVVAAVKSLLQINIAKQDSAQKNVHVVYVEKINYKLPVYNISVSGCHEYYANGILVHNCDIMRYAVMYREKADDSYLAMISTR